MSNIWLTSVRNAILVRNHPIIPWTNSLCTANLNYSVKLFKSPKRLMKWYTGIYILLKHVNKLDYQLFLQRTSEGRTANVWNENEYIYNWPLIKKMSQTARICKPLKIQHCFIGVESPLNIFCSSTWIIPL